MQPLRFFLVPGSVRVSLSLIPSNWHFLFLAFHLIVLFWLGTTANITPSGPESSIGLLHFPQDRPSSRPSLVGIASSDRFGHYMHS